MHALNRYDCTNQETEILLRGIKPHSATGPDGVTSWMLRSFAKDIAPSVSSLFNLSIRVGRIPTDRKLSHVVPIPKGSSCHDVQSFRPISLLSILSKCLEKHLYQLLLEHFESNFVLSDSQFGFRKGLSTIVPFMAAFHHWHQCIYTIHKLHAPISYTFLV